MDDEWKYDEALKNMARKMKAKYDKQWGEYADFNYLLLVCVALDPRYKMKYVRWNIKLLCDNDMVKAGTITDKVEEAMEKIYKFYESSISSQHHQKVEDSRIEKDVSSERSMYNILDEKRDKEWEIDMMAEDFDVKSELEIYLSEKIEPQAKDFDILSWWKCNAPRYPIVSKMARELLVVPVSTVSSESAFSTGGRILDQFRSSLIPRTVESLICAQNWLKSPSEPIQLREKLLELEKYEEIASELDGAVMVSDED